MFYFEASFQTPPAWLARWVCGRQDLAFVGRNPDRWLRCRASQCGQPGMWVWPTAGEGGRNGPRGNWHSGQLHLEGKLSRLLTAQNVKLFEKANTVTSQMHAVKFSRCSQHNSVQQLAQSTSPQPPNTAPIPKKEEQMRRKLRDLSKAVEKPTPLTGFFALLFHLCSNNWIFSIKLNPFTISQSSAFGKWYLPTLWKKKIWDSLYVLRD